MYLSSSEARVQTWAFFAPERFDQARLESRFGGVAFMRDITGSMPSIVPLADAEDVYLVEDDLGRLGRVWREADAGTATFEAVVTDLLTGQYSRPVRVVVFNVAQGWSRDASADAAHELRRRCDLQMRDVPFYLHDFTDRHEGRFHDVQLPLPMPLCFV